MKIKQAFVLMLALLLSACSTTTVHLYGKFLTEQQISETALALKKQGFDVEVNQLSFPDQVNGSTILYSPFIGDQEKLARIEQTLATLNWQVNESLPLTSGNHWYGKNSLGLLLLPDGVKAHMTAQDMVGEYRGFNCDQGVALFLDENGKYTVVYDDASKAQLSGTWRIVSFPYVELSTIDKDWPMYYELHKTVGRDQVSIRESLSLTPLKTRSFFPSCEFVNGAKF